MSYVIFLSLSLKCCVIMNWCTNKNNDLQNIVSIHYKIFMLSSISMESLQTVYKDFFQKLSVQREFILGTFWTLVSSTIKNVQTRRNVQNNVQNVSKLWTHCWTLFRQNIWSHSAPHGNIKEHLVTLCDIYAYVLT